MKERIMKTHQNHLKKLHLKIKRILNNTTTADEERLMKEALELSGKEIVNVEKVPDKIYHISKATAVQLFNTMNKCLVCHRLFDDLEYSSGNIQNQEEDLICTKCECGCKLTIETGPSFILIIMQINKGKDELIGEVYKNLFNQQGTFETTIKMKNEELLTDEVMYYRLSNSALETITNFTKKMDEILVLM